jgi:hypothetical protein
MSLYEDYRSGVSAVALHRSVLKRFEMEWLGIYSHDTCLSCVRRRPEFEMPCHHLLCETCFKNLGQTDYDDPWLFHLDRCLFCQKQEHVKMRSKPHTASVRVFSLDGGGARGRAHLAFFQVLEERHGLPLQTFFDVVYATSSGESID